MSKQPIPKEVESLIDFFTTLEEMAYAAKQKLLLPYQPVEKTSLPKPTVPPTQFTAKDQHNIESAFPEELAKMLSFTQQNGKWIIKPKQFLGAENFAKIASVIRGISGEYISAGQNSHFTAPIKEKY